MRQHFFNSHTSFFLLSLEQSAFSRGIGSQVMYNKSMAGVQNWSMLEDQSRNLLSENERGTMMYYLEEYQRNTITVEALVMALFELFDTHAKV